MAEVSIIWRRLDQPGHEVARLLHRDPGWHLTGTTVFASDGQPCRLDYLVVCDPEWKTLSGRVSGWLGAVSIEIKVEAKAGRWTLDGVDCPALAGCTDLDLSFSPSTNLLPIRRLGLAVGAEAPVRAAWLRFPNIALEPLDQLYRRTGEMTYRYESDGGKFNKDLQVNTAGFVTEYPGFWRAEESHL
jgi:hypothetical protein